MPYLTLPDGNYIRVPEGMSEQEALRKAEERFPMAFADTSKAQSGIGAAFGAGLRGAGSALSTAAAPIFGQTDEEIRQAYRKGQALEAERFRGTSLEDVKKAYRESGIFGESAKSAEQHGALRTLLGMWGEQAAQSLPQMGAAMAGGVGGGALAGSFFGPVGTVIGGGLGALAANVPFFTGSNVQAQIRAQEESGKQEPLAYGRAVAAALPQAGLEAAETLIPLGRLGVSKGVIAAIESLGAKRGEAELVKAAERSLLAASGRGAVKGIGVEVPVEIAQQVLERAQAGKSVLDRDAMNDYVETAVGTVGPGALFGGVGGVHGRMQATDELRDLRARQQAEAQLKAQQDALAAQQQEEATRRTDALDNYARLYREVDRLESNFLGYAQHPGLREQYAQRLIPLRQALTEAGKLAKDAGVTSEEMLVASGPRAVESRLNVINLALAKAQENNDPAKVKKYSEARDRILGAQADAESKRQAERVSRLGEEGVAAEDQYLAEQEALMHEVPPARTAEAPDAGSIEEIERLHQEARDAREIAFWEGESEALQELPPARTAETSETSFFDEQAQLQGRLAREAFIKGVRERLSREPYEAGVKNIDRMVNEAPIEAAFLSSARGEETRQATPKQLRILNNLRAAISKAKAENRTKPAATLEAKLAQQLEKTYPPSALRKRITRVADELRKGEISKETSDLLGLQPLHHAAYSSLYPNEQQEEHAARFSRTKYLRAQYDEYMAKQGTTPEAVQKATESGEYPVDKLELAFATLFRPRFDTRHHLAEAYDIAQRGKDEATVAFENNPDIGQEQARQLTDQVKLYQSMQAEIEARLFDQGFRIKREYNPDTDSFDRRVEPLPTMGEGFSIHNPNQRELALRAIGTRLGEVETVISQGLAKGTFTKENMVNEQGKLKPHGREYVRLEGLRTLLRRLQRAAEKVEPVQERPSSNPRARMNEAEDRLENYLFDFANVIDELRKGDAEKGADKEARSLIDKAVTAAVEVAKYRRQIGGAMYKLSEAEEAAIRKRFEGEGKEAKANKAAADAAVDAALARGKTEIGKLDADEEAAIRKDVKDRLDALLDDAVTSYRVAGIPLPESVGKSLLNALKTLEAIRDEHLRLTQPLFARMNELNLDHTQQLSMLNEKVSYEVKDNLLIDAGATQEERETILKIIDQSNKLLQKQQELYKEHPKAEDFRQFFSRVNDIRRDEELDEEEKTDELRRLVDAYAQRLGFTDKQREPILRGMTISGQDSEFALIKKDVAEAITDVAGPTPANAPAATDRFWETHAEDVAEKRRRKAAEEHLEKQRQANLQKNPPSGPPQLAAEHEKRYNELLEQFYQRELERLPKGGEGSRDTLLAQISELERKASPAELNKTIEQYLNQQTHGLKYRVTSLGKLIRKSDTPISLYRGEIDGRYVIGTKPFPAKYADTAGGAENQLIGTYSKGVTNAQLLEDTLADFDRTERARRVGFDLSRQYAEQKAALQEKLADVEKVARKRAEALAEAAFEAEGNPKVQEATAKRKAKNTLLTRLKENYSAAMAQLERSHTEWLRAYSSTLEAIQKAMGLARAQAEKTSGKRYEPGTEAWAQVKKTSFWQRYEVADKYLGLRALRQLLHTREFEAFEKTQPLLEVIKEQRSLRFKASALRTQLALMENLSEKDRVALGEEAKKEEQAALTAERLALRELYHLMKKEENGFLKRVPADADAAALKAEYEKALAEVQEERSSIFVPSAEARLALKEQSQQVRSEIAQTLVRLREDQRKVLNMIGPLKDPTTGEPITLSLAQQEAMLSPEFQKIMTDSRQEMEAARALAKSAKQALDRAQTASGMKKARAQVREAEQKTAEQEASFHDKLAQFALGFNVTLPFTVSRFVVHERVPTSYREVKKQKRQKYTGTAAQKAEQKQQRLLWEKRREPFRAELETIGRRLIDVRKRRGAVKELLETRQLNEMRVNILQRIAELEKLQAKGPTLQALNEHVASMQADVAALDAMQTQAERMAQGREPSVGDPAFVLRQIAQQRTALSRQISDAQRQIEKGGQGAEIASQIAELKQHLQGINKGIGAGYKKYKGLEMSDTALMDPAAVPPLMQGAEEFTTQELLAEYEALAEERDDLEHRYTLNSYVETVLVPQDLALRGAAHQRIEQLEAFIEKTRIEMDMTPRQAEEVKSEPKDSAHAGLNAQRVAALNEIERLRERYFVTTVKGEQLEVGNVEGLRLREETNEDDTRTAQERKAQETFEARVIANVRDFVRLSKYIVSVDKRLQKNQQDKTPRALKARAALETAFNAARRKFQAIQEHAAKFDYSHRLNPDLYQSTTATDTAQAEAMRAALAITKREYVPTSKMGRVGVLEKTGEASQFRLKREREPKKAPEGPQTNTERVEQELVDAFGTKDALKRIVVFRSLQAFNDAVFKQKYAGLTKQQRDVAQAFAKEYPNHSPFENISGLTYGKADHVALFADMVQPGEALPFAIHELGAHVGFKKYFSPAEYNALVETVKRWGRMRNDTLESRIAKAALARMQNASVSEETYNDELLAYAAEEAVRHGVDPTAGKPKGGIGLWLKRLFDAFKHALTKLSLSPEKMTAQDLVGFAYGAAQLEIRGASSKVTQSFMEETGRKGNGQVTVVAPRPSVSAKGRQKGSSVERVEQDLLRMFGTKQVLNRVVVFRSAKDFDLRNPNLTKEQKYAVQQYQHLVEYEGFPEMPSDAAGVTYSHAPGRPKNTQWHGMHVVLFADNISAGKTTGVVLHELGAHVGFKNLFSAGEYKALVNTVRQWAKRTDNSLETRIARAALRRVEEAQTGKEQADDELLAYAVEEAVNAGVDPQAPQGKTPLTNWLKRLFDAFKQALRVLKLNPERLTAQDLVGFAYGAAQLEVRGGYHGTDTTFERFDARKENAGEGSYAERVFEGQPLEDMRTTQGPYVGRTRRTGEYYKEAVPENKGRPPASGRMARTIDFIPDDEVYNLNSYLQKGTNKKLDALIDRFLPNAWDLHDEGYPANALFYAMRSALGYKKAAQALKDAGFRAVERDTDRGRMRERAYIDEVPDIVRWEEEASVGTQEQKPDAEEGKTVYFSEKREQTAPTASVEFNNKRGIVSNESVLGGLRRITEEDTVAEDAPRRVGAVMLTGLTRQAGGKKGRASDVLRALTLWADKNNETLVLMPAASGDLKQADLIKWYERNGFVQAPDGAMERVPNQNPVQMRMYHGSPNANIEGFEGLTFFSPSKEVASQYAKGQVFGAGKTSASGGKVYPVDVAVQNALDLRKAAHREAYQKARTAWNKEHDVDEHLPRIDSEGFVMRGSGLPSYGHVRNMLKALPQFDSAWVDEGSQGVSLAVATGKTVYFSKTKVPAGLERLGTLVQGVVAQDASKVKTWRREGLLGLETSLFDQLAPIKRIVSRMADTNAGQQILYYLYKQRNLMSMAAASARDGALKIIDIGNGAYRIGSGGGPSLKTVDEKLRPLVAMGFDAKTSNELFTSYLIGLRADEVGWDKLGWDERKVDSVRAKVAEIMKMVGGRQDIKAVLNDAATEYNAYNKGLIDFAEKTGGITKQMADAMRKTKNYVPYYRQRPNGIIDLMLDADHPIPVGDYKRQPYLHKLVGDDAPILDFFASSMQNTIRLTEMSLQNIAMRNLAFEMNKLGLVEGKEVKGVKHGLRKGKSHNQPTAIDFKDKDGNDMHVILKTEGTAFSDIPVDLLSKGLEGVSITIPEGLKLLGLPAKWLRMGITLNPLFPFYQLYKDALSMGGSRGMGYSNTGNILKVVNKYVRGKDLINELQSKGLISGRQFTGTVEDIASFRRQILEGEGMLHRAIAMQEANAARAEGATRAALYESYIKQGFNERDAEIMTEDAMPYAQRGLSPLMRLTSHVIPFFNAQVVGLHSLYKAFRGTANGAERARIKQKLLSTGIMMTLGTLAYASAVGDEDWYKRMPEETRLRNWLIKTSWSDDPIAIPIPFEFGIIFKATAEAVAQGMFDSSPEGKKMRGAYATLIAGSVPGLSNMFTPQAVTPLVEVGVNKSLIDGSNIETLAEQEREPFQRFRAGTSEIAKTLGEIANISPIKIDHLIRGYTGTLGVAVSALVDAFTGPSAETGFAPEAGASKLPLVGQLFKRGDGNAIVNLAVETMHEAGKVTATYNDMIQKGQEREAEAYFNQHIDEIAKGNMYGKFRQRMGEYKKAETAIIADPKMTAREKRDTILQLRKDLSTEAQDYLDAFKSAA